MQCTTLAEAVTWQCEHSVHLIILLHAVYTWRHMNLCKEYLNISTTDTYRMHAMRTQTVYLFTISGQLLLLSRLKGARCMVRSVSVSCSAGVLTSYVTLRTVVYSTRHRLVKRALHTKRRWRSTEVHLKLISCSCAGSVCVWKLNVLLKLVAITPEPLDRPALAALGHCRLQAPFCWGFLRSRSIARLETVYTLQFCLCSLSTSWSSAFHRHGIKVHLCNSRNKGVINVIEWNRQPCKRLDTVDSLDNSA